jgi:hypothetical protein
MISLQTHCRSNLQNRNKMRNGTNPLIFYTLVEATILWSNIQRYSKSAAIDAQNKFRTEQHRAAEGSNANIRGSIAWITELFEPKFALVLIKINSTKRLFSLLRSSNRLTSAKHQVATNK